MEGQKEIRKLDKYFKEVFGVEWGDENETNGRRAVRPGTNRSDAQGGKRNGIKTNVQRGETK